MLRRLFFAAITTALVLLLLEGLARLVERSAPLQRVMPTPRPGAMTPEFERRVAEAKRQGGAVALLPDERRGWTLPPSRVETYNDVPMRINALGLRGPELLPKGEGELRILTLGDSSVFGLGVPEALVFSSVAASTLTQELGRPVSAVIGAVPGYSSGQALEQLQRVGAQVDPDWVVIGTLWSDLYAGREAPWEERTRQLRGALGQLASARLMSRALEGWMRPRRVRWMSSQADLPRDSSGARVPLPRYAKNLRSMGELAANLGARPVYLMLAAPMDIDPAPPPALVLEYREAMRLIAAEQGAPVVDGPALARAQGATLAWWMDNVHPDVLGQQSLGEGLAQAIQSLRP